MTRPRTVLVVTGEASGDAHAARLVEELLALDPHLRVLAVGGEALAAVGATLLHRIDDLSVVGLTEVVRHLPRILRVMASLKTLLRSGEVDLFLPVDFPDFNFRLAAAAKRSDVPVFYFIAPQVWAWRTGRTKSMACWCRHIAVIFPFEAPFFEGAGIPVTYAGHPLVDRVCALDAGEARREIGRGNGRPLLALFPGSRASEVQRHLPVMTGAVRRLRDAGHEVDVLVSRAPTISDALIRHLSDGHDVLQAPTTNVARAADLVFCASGTATVEVALAGTPMVVIYRVSALSWFLGRRLVKLDRVSMVNLVAGEEVVPELLQGEARPERLAAEGAAILDDPERACRMREGYGRVRDALMGGVGLRQVAEEVLSVIGEGGRNE